MPDTTTTFDPALKQIYRNKRVQELTFTTNPLLGMIPKYEDFGGRNYPLVLKYGESQGRSAVFSTAQANASNTSLAGFTLTRTANYSVAQLSGELALAAKGDRATFLEALSAVIDGAFANLARDINIMLYRNGGGARGRVGSTSTVTCTLLSSFDAVNFEVGMKVDNSSTDGTSGSVLADPKTITAVDRNAGTLTASTNWTAGGNYAANSYIFAQGDFGAAIKGLGAWVPTSAPSATAFFGVDRTADSVRLGGVRHSASGQSKEEALIEICSKISAQGGGRPDVALMNHKDLRDLMMLLGTKNTYERVQRTAMGADGTVASIGYRAVRIDGPDGPIDCIADNACPQGFSWVLQMDTWGLYSLGPATRLLDLDGNRVLRSSGADSYEARVGFYGSPGCDAPGNNGVVTF